MKRLIKNIVIHCSATPNGRDFRAKDIDAMHKARNFNRSSQAVRNFNPTLKHIGYHGVICIDGAFETGRGLEEIGAHVAGKNSDSIGIVLIGTDKYALKQWETLRTYIINLSSIIQGKPHATAEGALNAYKDMGIKILGHRDFSPDHDQNGIIDSRDWIKTCPGFDVKNWLKNGMMPVTESLLNGI